MFFSQMLKIAVDENETRVRAFSHNEKRIKSRHISLRELSSFKLILERTAKYTFTLY